MKNRFNDLRGRFSKLIGVGWVCIAIGILCVACQTELGSSESVNIETSNTFGVAEIIQEASSTASLLPTATPSSTPSLSPTPMQSPSEIVIEMEAVVVTPETPVMEDVALETAIISPTMLPATATPFPTASFTPGTGRMPTRTYTATLKWPLRKRTATPTLPPSATVTLTPTITLTPTPQQAYLRLARPGSFSRVVSPFRLEANVAPGEDGMVRIDLVGEDSRMITSQLLNNRQDIGRRFWIAPHIGFEITAVAETARLVLSVQDLFGRKIALTSIDLILLFLGDNEIMPSGSTLEPYIIWNPKLFQSLQGGKVWVNGLASPVNDRPLIVELIDENGNIVGSAQTLLITPEGEHTHAYFEVLVPYLVEQTTPVRLTLRQESAGRIPGTVALSSLLIILEP